MRTFLTQFSSGFKARARICSVLFLLPATSACVIRPMPGTNENAIDNDSAPVVREGELVQFAVRVGGGAVDLSALHVGDQIVFSVPASGSARLRVAGTSCSCQWSVMPETAGSFDPQGACTTVYTVEEEGAAVISVLQQCEAADTIQFTQTVTSMMPVPMPSNNGMDNDNESMIPEPESNDNESTDEDPIIVAGVLTADAGPDRQAVEGATVSLDGSESAGSGDGALGFSWRQTEGTAVVLSAPMLERTTFVAPQVGANGAMLAFELTVSEGEQEASDRVLVTIFDSAPGGTVVTPPPPPPVNVNSNDNGNNVGNNNSSSNINSNSNDNSNPPPDVHVFRGVYGESSDSYLNPGGVVDQLLEDGFEDFAIKLPSMRVPMNGTDRVRLGNWSQRLNAHGARLWVFFNWFALLEHDWLAPGGALPVDEQYVGPDGVAVGLKPCPQSQSFWNRAITARFQEVATFASLPAGHPNFVSGVSTALRGVLLDPELYTFSERTYRDPCYCDACFTGYFTLLGIVDPIPPAAQRATFLQTNGLVGSYSIYEQMTVRALAAGCRDAMRAIRPTLEIGGTNILRFDRSSFYIGLAQGFGTQDRPYYDWSQRTFNFGYNNGVPAFLLQAATAGVHIVFLPGLITPRMPPDAISDHFYTLGVETGGAWLSSSAHYADSMSELCFPLSQYRAALATANDELDLYEGDPNHMSSFTGAPFVPGCLDMTAYNVAAGLVPLEAGAPVIDGIRMRDEVGYFFHANAGDPIAFDVSLTEIGTNDTGSGFWVLLGPGAVRLAASPLTGATSPFPVRATAQSTGVYTLVLNNSFQHEVRIFNASHPGGYRAVRGAQVLALFQAYQLPGPQLFAYMPPGVTSAVFSIKPDGSERPVIRIFDERDLLTPLLDQCIPAGPTETLATVNLGLGNPAGGNGVVLNIHIVREVACSPNPNDLDFKVAGGASLFLAQTRSGLLRVP